MRIIGRVEILDSFHVTKRGLIARGNILEGVVKIGSFTNLNLENRKATLRIDGVEMIDNISTQEYWVGLLFAYDRNNEIKELSHISLKYQIVEIVEQD
jgi:translation elongation factor EF-Tu-like GTPase